MSDLQRETLDEYLITYEYLTEKINRFDERIEEIARIMGGDNPGSLVVKAAEDELRKAAEI